MAILPGQELVGELRVNSATWQYIKSWAMIEMERAREANDSIKKGFEETCVLRGEIKILKKLIELPAEQVARRGLLEAHDFKDNTFAGY